MEEAEEEEEAQDDVKTVLTGEKETGSLSERVDEWSGKDEGGKRNLEGRWKEEKEGGRKRNFHRKMSRSYGSDETM